MCPNPLKAPLSLSSANRIDAISPQDWNASRRVSSSIWKERFPTKTVVHPGSLWDDCRGAVMGLGPEYLTILCQAIREIKHQLGAERFGKEDSWHTNLTLTVEPTSIEVSAILFNSGGSSFRIDEFNYGCARTPTIIHHRQFQTRDLSTFSEKIMNFIFG